MVVAGSSASKGFSLCCRGQKKQGPNYFGLEQSKAFGQKHANVTTPLRIGLVDSSHQPLVPRSYCRPSFFIPRSLSSPSTTPTTTFSSTSLHQSTPFLFFSHLLPVCLVNNSPWSHTLATSFVVAWSKLRACPSSSVVMAKARSQLRFPRGAPSFWLGLSSSSFSSPAL